MDLKLMFLISGCGFHNSNLISGFGPPDLDLMIWMVDSWSSISGSGFYNLDLKIWTWISGPGVKDLVFRIWIWHSGFGFQYRDL